jgi:hypothetical protein
MSAAINVSYNDVKRAMQVVGEPINFIKIICIVHWDNALRRIFPRLTSLEEKFIVYP